MMWGKCIVFVFVSLLICSTTQSDGLETNKNRIENILNASRVNKNIGLKDSIYFGKNEWFYENEELLQSISHDLSGIYIVPVLTTDMSELVNLVVGNSNRYDCKYRKEKGSLTGEIDFVEIGDEVDFRSKKNCILNFFLSKTGFKFEKESEYSVQEKLIAAKILHECENIEQKWRCYRNQLEHFEGFLKHSVK